MTRPFLMSIVPSWPFRTRLLSTASALLALAVFVLISPRGDRTAHAQGFGIFEQSSCASGSGGTAVANACDDGSAIYFNPSGLTEMEGWTFSGGVTNIIQVGEFTFDDTRETTDIDSPVSVLPHLYATYRATERLGVGVGAYVPFGLNTRWPADFAGSFSGFDNNLQSIYIQPTAAYQLTDRVSVGGGLIVGVSTVELNQRLDLAEQQAEDGITFANLGIPPGTPFGEATLDADPSVGSGGNFGLEVELTDRLDVGARFTTPVNIDYSGEASFQQVETGIELPANNPLGVPAGTPVDALVEDTVADGPLVTQDLSTDITMPAQLVAGLSFQATPRLNLMFDYQWTGWSTLESVELDFENPNLDDAIVLDYDNSSGFRFGTEFAVDETWTLRGGYVYNTPASPDQTVTPLAPESDRNRFSLGVGVRPLSGVELNLAYQFLMQNDRRGRTRGPAPGQEISTDLNDGLFSLNAHIIGTTLTVRL